MLVICWLLAVVLILVAGVAVMATGQFESVYLSFEAEIPWTTRLFLEFRYAWLLLPVLAIALAMWVSSCKTFSRFGQAKAWFAVVAIFVLSFVVLAFAFFSLYLPIFRLGQMG